MKPNFSDDTKLEALERAGWVCEVCGKNDILDCHHRLSNSKMNQNKYGRNLQGLENLAILCRECHLNGKVLKSLKIDKETLKSWEV
jgi:5-methylcytosine-specific restriction endonuclease McrA